MAQFLLRFQVRDTLSGDTREKSYRFDPTSVPATAWGTLKNAVIAAAQELLDAHAADTDTPPLQ